MNTNIQTPTTEQIKSAFADDPVLKRLNEREAQYRRQEQARMIACQSQVKVMEKALAELKKQRRILTGRIRNQSTSIKAAKERAKFRKATPLHIERLRQGRRMRIKHKLQRQAKLKFAEEWNRKWYQSQLAQPVPKNS